MKNVKTFHPRVFQVTGILSLLILFSACNLFFDPGNGTTGDESLTAESTDSSDAPDSGNTLVIPREIWGTWTRMDSGESYYFSDNSLILNRDSDSPTVRAVTSVDGSSKISIGSDSFELVSSNVLRFHDYYLFREGGANRSFRARIAGFQDTVAQSIARMAVPGQGTEIRRRNPSNENDAEDVEADPDGHVGFSDAVSDDEQEITVVFENPSGESGEVTLITRPEYDDEFIGTIPLVEEGYNFKTRYSVNPDQLVNGYMYGNAFDTYELEIFLENIGDSEARTTIWNLVYPDGLSTSSPVDGNFSTIPAGDSRSINQHITAGNIDGDFQDFEIKVEITDTDEGRTWEDYVVLRFFRLPVQFRVRAYNIDGGGSLKAFIVSPENRSTWFETYHDSSNAVTLPYREDPYILAFSGAGHLEEMKYSFTVNSTPNPLGDETWSFDQISKFRDYDSEYHTYLIDNSAQPVDGYLGMAEITFFTVDLNELGDEYYRPIVYSAHVIADTGNEDGIVNPGETISLDMRIQNASRSAIDISAALSSDSPYIDFSRHEFHYGAISAGHYQTISNRDLSNGSSAASDLAMDAETSNAFTFTVAEHTPVHTEIPITLSFTDSKSNTWVEEFTITVYESNANMVYHAHMLGANNSTDILPTPGDNVTMDIRVQNEGTSNAMDVTAVLSSNSPYIDFTQNEFHYGTISAERYMTIGEKNTRHSGFTGSTSDSLSMNASAANAFAFTISEDTPDLTEIPVSISFTDSQTNTWTDEFSFTVYHYVVGDSGPAGGIIFYIDEANEYDWTYLESWTADEEGGTFQWKTSNTDTPGTSVELGSGYRNTYEAMTGPEHPAAETARNADHGGYSDWFLPSRIELIILQPRNVFIGGFLSEHYWTSSEVDTNRAYSVNFSNGYYSSDFKGQNRHLRVIRSF
ncbi:Lcl domain-containing protein [Spirochaeta dissipatitropha]